MNSEDSHDDLDGCVYDLLLIWVVMQVPLKLCNSYLRSIGSADSAEHTVGTRYSLSSGR